MARFRVWWLWLSFPVALLAIAVSVAGITSHAVYARETRNWAGQSVGQDIANLILYPLLVVGCGSLRAYLVQCGLLVYSAYTFVLYCFEVHFGPLFLLYVAVLGLSVYALIGGLLAVDPVAVKRLLGASERVRATAVVLVVVACGFAALWLSADLPAEIRNAPPKELRDAGLFTNGVHVLDLALFLPAMLIAGVSLYRGRPLGFLLAPVVLVASIAIAVGIVSLSAVLRYRQQGSISGAVVVGVVALFEGVVLYRFLRPGGDALALAVYVPAAHE